MNLRRANEVLKGYRTGRSIKYVLKLKHVGDWLVKNNVFTLLRHVADNNGKFLGIDIRFSSKTLGRSMSKALKFRKEEHFHLVKRLMGGDIHAKSDGTKLSTLLELVKKCAGEILWADRALLWMGASKLEQVLQRAAQPH